MAASIPVLRVLVIQIKTSAERYYYDSRGNRSHGTSNNGNMKDPAAISRSNQPRANYESTSRDDSSERSIFGAHRWKKGIVQTNEIRLEYSHRDAREANGGGWNGAKNDIGHAV